MNAPSTSQRAIRALALGPMTAGQVAKCLCISQETARRNLSQLSILGLVRRNGWARASKRKAQVFEVIT